LLLALCLSSWPGHAASGAESAAVVEVVDGDTIRVRMRGEAATVRLIGIDTPERGHPSKPKEFIADEAADALSALCLGKSVRLEKDLEETDKYGRLLRYVFSADGGILFNRELLLKGVARVYRRFPFSRRPEFEEAERLARREGIGLWHDRGLDELRWARSHGREPVTVWLLGGEEYGIEHGGMGKAGMRAEALQPEIARLIRMKAGMSGSEFVAEALKAGYGPLEGGSTPEAVKLPDAASPPAGIVPWERARDHLGREVTVEGTVVRSRRSGKTVFLNFHDNWKRYPTVVLFTGRVAGLPDEPETAYRGRKIRVRGTVKLYKERPEIVVVSGDDIRIVP
jgi:micrococcal nuclease